MIPGNRHRTTASFLDDNDDPADPTVITVTIHPPTGSTMLAPTSYVYGIDAGVVRDSIGEYHFDFTPDVPGMWECHWSGTGVVVAAGYETLSVDREVGH